MVCVAIWPIVLMLIFVLASTFATGGIVSGGAGLALKRPRRAVILSFVVGFTLLLCSGWSGVSLHQMLPIQSWEWLVRFALLLSGIGSLAVAVTLVAFRIFGIESANMKHDESKRDKGT